MLTREEFTALCDDLPVRGKIEPWRSRTFHAHDDELRVAYVNARVEGDVLREAIRVGAARAEADPTLALSLFRRLAGTLKGKKS